MQTLLSHEVSISVLAICDEADLAEIGIPKGPRVKILRQIREMTTPTSAVSLVEETDMFSTALHQETDVVNDQTAVEQVSQTEPFRFDCWWGGANQDQQQPVNQLRDGCVLEEEGQSS
eukprot:COSAG01_NODE_40143_length_467_cov_0.978261_1_plen_117_part_01